MKSSEKSTLKERFLALPIWFWLIFIAIICAADAIRRFVFDGGCVMMDILDFPCPTCGMTRASLCAMTFQFKRAFEYNPAFWVFPLCGICLIMSFADKKRARLWGIIFSILIAILFITWIVYRIILRAPLANSPMPL